MGTLPEWWTAPYPEVSSVFRAAAYVDAIGGDLTQRQEGGAWVLSTGSQELYRCDSEQELQSFVLGFALAHLIVERHGLIGRAAPAPSATSDMGPVAAAPNEVPAPPPPPPAAPPLQAVPDPVAEEDEETAEALDVEDAQAAEADVEGDVDNPWAPGSAADEGDEGGEGDDGGEPADAEAESEPAVARGFSSREDRGRRRDRSRRR